MTTSAMMSRIIVLCLSILAIPSPLSAQKAKSPSPSTVLATVGTEKVTYGDVERAFKKNLTRRDTPFSSVPRDTALDFLRLFTNYRLKVANAKERGLADDPAIQEEIEKNRKLLSETWYFDKAFADERIAQLARRRTKEIKIGIILCAVMDTTTRKWDTAASRAKAEEVVARLKKGANFEQLARELSDDKETGAEGGMLPYISGGSIIKSVEDEAYALKLGEFSKTPVESRFGYFVVKVFDVKDREVIKFRHILLRAKEGRDSAATERFADTVLRMLKAPRKVTDPFLISHGYVVPTDDLFSDMAKAFSDDNASADKGGYLGSPYSRSGGMESNGARLVGEFEEAVFGLKDGETSGKVRTIFGIHIVRRDSTKYPDEVLERDNAKRTYRRLYFEDDKRAHFDSLKTALKYAWVDETYRAFTATIDTNRNTSDTSWWRPISDDLYGQAIYTMPSRKITVKQFTDSLRQRMDLKGYTLNRAGLERAMNKIVDPIVLDQVTATMESKDPEFAALVKEFSDGILLFKVEEQEVWSKLKFDTTDAKAFHDTTRSRWMTERMYRLTEIYTLTEDAAKKARARVDAGENFATVAEEMTQRQGIREKSGALGIVGPRTNAMARKAEEEKMKPGEVIGPFKEDKGFALLRLDEIIAPRPKTFEEALPDLAPAYQDALQQRLTEAWLSGVRKRYPVKVDSASIDAIWGPAASSKGRK
jgi:peptidyl-prolyl cis-trans isomerase SurA